MARGGWKRLGREPVEVEETSAGSVLMAVAAAVRLLVGPVRPGAGMAAEPTLRQPRC